MKKLILLLSLLPALAWAAPTPPTRPLTRDANGNLQPSNLPIYPSAANKIMARDVDNNTTANSFIGGYTPTVTTGGTTTLTVKSTTVQRFTGVSSQTVDLPAVTTLALNQEFLIINDSTGIISVRSTGGNAIVALAPGTFCAFESISTSGTGAGSWRARYNGITIASGKLLTVSNTITLIGTDGTSHTMPTTSSTLARTDAANNFLGVQKMENSASSSPTPHGDSGATENFTALKEAHTVTLNVDSVFTMIDFAPFGGNRISVSIQLTQKGGFNATIVNARMQPQINPTADSITNLLVETWDGGTTFDVYSDYFGDIAPRSIQAASLPGTNDLMSAALTITGMNAGDSLTQWDAVYVSAAGTWLKADANGANTYPARGLAATTVNTATTVTVLVQGVVRHDAWAWTKGLPIYLSGTTGEITQTAPVIPGDKIQEIGYSLTADSAYFNFASASLGIASGTPSPTPTATASATATATATATPTVPPSATPTATATATATSTPTATPNFLVNQHFEGNGNNGYDNAETWTHLNADPNSTAFAALGFTNWGAQSLLVNEGHATTTFSSQTDVWYFGEFYIPSGGLPDTTGIAGPIFDTGTKGVWMRLSPLGQVAIESNFTDAGAAGVSAGTISEEVHYYCWFHVVKGGTSRLYINTSATMPGDGDDNIAGARVMSVTTGSTGSAANGFTLLYLYNSSPGTLIAYDHVLGSASAIGSNPP